MFKISIFPCIKRILRPKNVISPSQYLFNSRSNIIPIFISNLPSSYNDLGELFKNPPNTPKLFYPLLSIFKFQIATFPIFSISFSQHASSLFPIPPARPIIRPQKLFIYSVFTLKKSLKNYPKHLKSLKIESNPSRYYDSQILPKSRLKSLIKRTKSLQILDLKNHKQLFELKVSQALSFIKSSQNLSSLTLFKNPTFKISDDVNGFKWVTFRYSSNALHDNNDYRSQNNVLLKSHIIRSHKRLRLLSIDPKACEELIAELEEYIQRFPRSTSEKLSASRKSLLKKFHFNLSHLHFQLYDTALPGSSNALLGYLHRLPTTDKIIDLKVFASDISHQNDENALVLQIVLNQLRSLRSLYLESYSFLCISPLSKSFGASSNLRKLTLEIPIQKQKELIELALFVGTLKNLYFLNIKNSKSVQGYAGKGHRIFFAQISGLAQLKSLQINLCGENKSSQKFQLFHGCLGEFAGCLQRLPELQEISFTQSELGVTPEFDALADALKKKGSKLKKLKLKFFNGEKKIDNLKKINKTFKTMENLEELSLSGLWTEKDSLLQFTEIISELKRVRSVKINGVNPVLENVDLVKALKRILVMYGLEELQWFGKYEISGWNYFRIPLNFLDIKEIVLKNPRLHRIRLDYYAEIGRGIGFKNVSGFLS